MKVYFVGAGPGDPDLLTVKAERLLRDARVCIYAGSLVNPELLKLLPADAARHDSASLNLDEIIALVEKASRDGVDVVRLHTGEPSIYGAIGEQMDALDRLGIEYEVVPGISSFQAAAAALRVELTAPEIAQTIILTRTPGRTPMPPAEDLSRLAESRATLCIFLSTDRIGELTGTLAKSYGPECPAALVYHASWPDEKIARGTLADIAARVQAEGIQRTAIFLVGHALARPAAARSKLYDKTFAHGYREASPP
jgi:precorrin-4/cobalt-precorrin-4 C11-methyltransferase